MKIQNRNQSILLFIGDILVLLLSLVITLAVRYGRIPDQTLLYNHLIPFSFIFAIWVIFYFIYDLYGSQNTLFQKRLANILGSVHIVNSIIALAFFYFIPYFAITPKTTLFIFLVISFALMTVWRRNLVFIISRGKEQNILFACSGAEAEELKDEFSHNPLYKVNIIDQVDISVPVTDQPLVVINTHDKNDSSLVDFYNMLFSGANFITLDVLYESVFGRVPISSISERWFLEEISLQPKPIYTFLKRLMDIIISLILGIASLILYPFVYVAIKLDGQGPIFITSERVGEKNRHVRLFKFRTMTVSNDSGEWGKVDNKITRVGAVLRKLRIDELPQLWNILLGDLSLIGPRPEFDQAVKTYGEVIKYYNIRHLIKPGLSGWAQIYGEHPHHSIGVEETKNKLSHDLYYLKYRSLLLDLKIALKTIRILLSRSGI